MSGPATHQKRSGAEEGTPPETKPRQDETAEQRQQRQQQEALVELYAGSSLLDDDTFVDFLKRLPVEQHAALLDQAVSRRAAVAAAEATAQTSETSNELILGGDDDGAKKQALEEAGYTPGELRQAAADGNLERVNELLSLALNPYCTDEMLAGWTALQYAAQQGQTAMCTALVEHHGFRVLAQDQNKETALMQAAYLGHTETVTELDRLEKLAIERGEEGQSSERLLAALGTSYPPPRILHDAPVEKWAWNTEDSVSIICSAPEYSRCGDKVMVGLFSMCRLFSDHTKFGYDWGGSVTAEPADKNPDRIVYSCCHSLSCTCPVKGSRVLWDVHGCCHAPISSVRPKCWCGKNGDAIKFGGVNWSRPESVAGSVRSPSCSVFTRVHTCR
jgi:hypothetical protein